VEFALCLSHSSKLLFTREFAARTFSMDDLPG
jgi:hypothetical protein